MKDGCLRLKGNATVWSRNGLCPLANASLLMRQSGGDGALCR